MSRVAIARAGLAVAAVAFVVPFAGSVAGAAAPDALTYVSPTGTSTNNDTSCSTAAFSSVQSAVDATSPGGTVVVCKGTYDASVTITGLLTLQGQPGAVIDAKGQPYAVGIAHSHDTVTGLTVENATANAKAGTPGDGIITAGFVGAKPVASDYDVIVGNIAKNNEGSGIDLNSTTGSVASDNIADGNGVGINLSNDLGAPSSHNLVSGNVTNLNPGGCGIALADHTGSGVFDNVITGNTANDNGLGTPSRPNASSGSGVILAAAGAGGVYGNVIESNRFSGNGHGGVVIHAHVKGLKFSGNQIIDNWIGTNNLRTDYKDTKTTGIYFGDVSKLSITVKGNIIHDDAVGVFSAGPVTMTGGSNAFQGVSRHFVRTAKYAAGG